MTQTSPRAPAVAQKLEAARSARAVLDQEVGQAALDAAEGVRGADKRLTDLRAKIAQADREVDELTKAHALALHLDNRAQLAGRAKMREAQLATFTGHARARDEIVTEMCGCIEKLADAYGRYVNLTARMMGTVPAGAHLPQMQRLIAAEAFRLIDVDAPIRAKLPFAAAPSLSLSDNPRAVENGAEVFREATAAVLKEIQLQISGLGAADAEALGTKVAA